MKAGSIYLLRSLQWGQLEINYKSQTIDYFFSTFEQVIVFIISSTHLLCLCQTLEGNIFNNWWRGEEPLKLTSNEILCLKFRFWSDNDQLSWNWHSNNGSLSSVKDHCIKTNQITGVQWSKKWSYRINKPVLFSW